ncbi:MAG: DUF952 domain-containing protein [Planctomycetota bacterium]
MTIYHLVWQSDWNKLVANGQYRASSLETEGFIHCTKEPEKLVEVANLFFAGTPKEDLLMLSMDESRVGSPVKYEDPGVGHLFPHIYGPLDIRAITAKYVMKRDGGLWCLPHEWTTP